MLYRTDAKHRGSGSSSNAYALMLCSLNYYQSSRCYAKVQLRAKINIRSRGYAKDVLRLAQSIADAVTVGAEFGAPDRKVCECVTK